MSLGANPQKKDQWECFVWAEIYTHVKDLPINDRVDELNRRLILLHLEEMYRTCCLLCGGKVCLFLADFWLTLFIGTQP